VITWTPTTDPTIRMSIRWQSFAHAAWQLLASNLDGTLGTYTANFTPLPDTPTADRWFCVDMQSTKGTLSSPWLSATGGQVCGQLPVTGTAPPLPPIVPPVVIPPVVTPPPIMATPALIKTTTAFDPTTNIVTITTTLQL